MSQFQRTGFGGFSMFPPVIKMLLISNGVVFFLQYFFFNIFRVGDVSLGDYFFHFCALQPFEGDFYFWQLFTYQFMHGSFSHLFFNLFALWMFGVELENMWGAKKFIIYYLLSGVGAALVQLFISPLLTNVGPTVGASGSIFGLFVAFAMMFPDRSIFVFPFFIPIKAKFLIIIMIGLDLLMGVTTNSSVAHFAHLGGAAAGFLLIKFGDKIGIFTMFEKQSQPKNVFSDHEYVKDNNVYRVNWNYREQNREKKESNTQRTFDTSLSIDGENITQAKIDDILDKISISGYQNLTEKEKRILFELSQRLK